MSVLQKPPQLIECTREEYHNREEVSQTQLKQAYENPQLFYGRYITKTIAPMQATASMQWGCDLEDFVRTGRLPEDVTTIPRHVLSASGQKRGKVYDAWKIGHEGDRLLTERESADLGNSLVAAVSNINNHKAASALIFGTLGGNWSNKYTFDSGYGFRMRCELDVEGESSIVDLKTTVDPTNEKFMRSIVNFGYDIQAYAYSMVHDFQKSYYIVAVRNTEPYDVEVYDLSELRFSLGRDRFERRADFFAHCIDTGDWHRDTHGEVIEPQVPAWAEYVL